MLHSSSVHIHRKNLCTSARRGKLRCLRACVRACVRELPYCYRCRAVPCVRACNAMRFLCGLRMRGEGSGLLLLFLMVRGRERWCGFREVFWRKVVVSTLSHAYANGDFGLGCGCVR
ncbi:hypothetical protein M3J09_001291 [Ascochyta lentis]